MNPNSTGIGNKTQLVVICFDFIIFALWIPTSSHIIKNKWKLWFASILLFLHYESQHLPSEEDGRASCDLLRFYYFCIMNPNQRECDWGAFSVVICFDFIIFALWIPTKRLSKSKKSALWFASILLFLHYESQRRLSLEFISTCCDLLRFYYFCIMNPNRFAASICNTMIYITD